MPNEVLQAFHRGQLLRQQRLRDEEAKRQFDIEQKRLQAETKIREQEAATRAKHINAILKSAEAEARIKEIEEQQAIRSGIVLGQFPEENILKFIPGQDVEEAVAVDTPFGEKIFDKDRLEAIKGAGETAIEKRFKLMEREVEVKEAPKRLTRSQEATQKFIDDEIKAQRDQERKNAFEIQRQINRKEIKNMEIAARRAGKAVTDQEEAGINAMAMDVGTGIIDLPKSGLGVKIRAAMPEGWVPFPTKNKQALIDLVPIIDALDQMVEFGKRANLPDKLPEAMVQRGWEGIKNTVGLSEIGILMEELEARAGLFARAHGDRGRLAVQDMLFQLKAFPRTGIRFKDFVKRIANNAGAALTKINMWIPPRMPEDQRRIALPELGEKINQLELLGQGKIQRRSDEIQAIMNEYNITEAEAQELFQQAVGVQ